MRKKENLKACDGCGIIEGGAVYNEMISFYKGYDLCQYCIKKRQELETAIGREATWSEFLDPGKLGL